MGDDRRSRRWVLRAGAIGGGSVLAGCTGRIFDDPDDSNGTGSDLSLADFRGSGAFVEDRSIDATSIADLPDLAGTLTVYIGDGEGPHYLDLIELLEEEYDEFDVQHQTAPSAQLANTILEEREGGSSPSDVFWAVDAGALGVVADEGELSALSDEVVGAVPERYRPGNEWVGVTGRARAIPYNSDELSGEDVPDDVFAFAEDDRFRDAMGWAPTYGAFQSFVTAMRLINGPDETKRWLEDMLAQGVEEYNNEFYVSNAVADGELAAGFANHYYALRVQADRADAPIELAFTRGDAGALINVSGAGVIEGTENRELAEGFVRHLLSGEAQEFFATRTYAYPVVSDVPPLGGLPSIDELDPPDVDLAELSDLEPTLELMREVGVLG